jgi:hypothetical protein
VTVVLLEGFDHLASATDFGTKGWVQTHSGTFNFDDNGISTPRVNGQSYYVATKSDASEAGHTFPTSFTMQKQLPSILMTCICGFGIKRTSNSEDDQIAVGLYTSAGALVVGIKFDSLGRPYLSNNSVASPVSSFIAVDNVWNYYEIKVVVAGAASTVELQVNGGPDIPTSTLSLGTVGVGQIVLQSAHDQRSPTSHGFYIDDLYVADTTGPVPRNDFLGDVRVETLYPNAEGAHLDWATSAGSVHFSLANEHPPDYDTTYVTSNTPDARDTYEHTDLTAAGVVYGVQVNMLARKTTSGFKKLLPLVRETGVDYEGAEKVMSTSWANYSHIWNQSPTGVDWTTTRVNQAQFGAKVVI